MIRRFAACLTELDGLQPALPAQWNRPFAMKCITLIVTEEKVRIEERVALHLRLFDDKVCASINKDRVC